MSKTTMTADFDYLLATIRGVSKYIHFRQGPKETDQHFFVRILTVFAEEKNEGTPLISDEDFAYLPDSVQNWYVKAIEAKKNNVEIEPPRGFVSKFATGKAKTAKAPKEKAHD